MARLFLILGRSRTGSNMLRHLLEQHPEIACKGEIFANVEGDGWQPKLAQLELPSVRWVGFKAFYYHGSSGFWEHLAADAAMPVVHMKRRNVLRTAVSRKLAAQQGQWAATGATDVAVEKSVSFAAAELERDFRKTRAYEAYFDQWFADHPTVHVEYEDFASYPLETCERVTNILGSAPLRSPQMKTHKQNPEPLSALIANYEDLKRHFASTRWAVFFE